MKKLTSIPFVITLVLIQWLIPPTSLHSVMINILLVLGTVFLYTSLHVISNYDGSYPNKQNIFLISISLIFYFIAFIISQL